MVKDKLTVKQLKILQEQFVNKRQELLKASDIEKIILDDGGDETDIIQSKILNDLTERFSKRDIQLIKKIDLALERMKNGTFGLCLDCEEPIGAKRIMALPHTSNCISCAEEKEIEERNFGIR